jgi:hypothetical protein
VNVNEVEKGQRVRVTGYDPDGTKRGGVGEVMWVQGGSAWVSGLGLLYLPLYDVEGLE